jgi:hypothetical protein
MRPLRSPGLLTVFATVFSALAGLLIASHAAGTFALLVTILAVGAAMLCGGLAAVQFLRPTSASAPASDEGDVTVEITHDGLALPPQVARGGSVSRTLVTTVGSFVAASAATVALLVGAVSWTSGRAVPPAAAPALSAASSVPDAVIPDPSPVILTTPEKDTSLKVRAIARPPDSSRVRRECLAQIESAHLFLTMAREAKGPGAYAQSTNPQIKRFSASRPVDSRTLQHIALRMWEQRHAPDRGPLWWSAQYARCEEARVAGGGYTVRG